MFDMGRIELLGGMSWESSVEYERSTNEEVRARLGGTHPADLVVRSFDLRRHRGAAGGGRLGWAGQLLADAASTLVGAGCEVIVLCAGTMHTLADRTRLHAAAAALGGPITDHEPSSIHGRP